jgi:hypothetical protein
MTKFIKIISIFRPRSMLRIFRAVFSKLYVLSKNTQYGRTIELEKLIYQYGFKTVVEVGVYDAKNIFYLAKKFPKTQFYGVDLWKYFPTERLRKLPIDSHEGWEELHKDILLEASKIPNVTLLRGYSNIESLKFEDKSLDLVFIDANHDYEYVKNDILAWLPKIKDSGLISGHDFSLQYVGVIKAVTEIFGFDNFDVLSDSVWVTQPKNKIE